MQATKRPLHEVSADVSSDGEPSRKRQRLVGGKERPLVLYNNVLCPFGARAWLALLVKGVQFETKWVSIDSDANMQPTIVAVFETVNHRILGGPFGCVRCSLPCTHCNIARPKAITPL